MLSRLPHAHAISLLLLASFAHAGIPKGYDFTDNYRPAPLPEDGPPGAFHASRNKALLPAQICGVVGSYIVTVLIWGILLLTVGRRMKRRTQNSPKTLELELVPSRYQTQSQNQSIASPLSARSATSWFKRGFKRNSNLSVDPENNPQSPVVQSPASFDPKVLSDDKDRAQAEMERLYAAVMDHDRKKSLSQISTEETGAHDRSRRTSSINTNPMRETSAQSNPSSPVQAVYPPNYHNGPPTAPLPRDRLKDVQPPASPRSILSKQSHKSSASTPTKTRFNLKNLRISGPVQKYPGEFPHDEARTPLSPRSYNPGAPPSPPQQASPITPADGDLEYEGLDEVQPLPHPAPQRLGSHPQLNIQTQAPTSATATAPGFRSGNSSTNYSPQRANALPLRGYAEPLKSPDLRTTVLDRRMEKLTMGTPTTGVPFTPYSPYMPFTPITPVTPHLTTKKERKMRAKMGGRKMADREDLVQSPKDIWEDSL
ncbi:hypothetical protein K504DRAFT_459661 [Pleomassaria siparia CBS 279.74]|uniref:Uncharacterized protein n=1 Tax=Pleomassaria siparia CBS 279.74 TaxID=1314801 RepID=A0A6G1K0N7_9PLEO|nr:hypothetical protein K504DRAFT_459661 [Pleomassaria siparia CBS 279.74]